MSLNERAGAIDRLTYTNALCVGDFVVNLQYKDWREYESISSNGKLVWLADRLIEDLQQHVEEDRVEYISKEEILAGIAEGLRDVKAGRTRPAEELLNELRNGISD